MTPVPKQAKKLLGQDNAPGGEGFASSTSGATPPGHVQSAVFPTQLGGFPSKTIEFGNHLVHQRAAFYKRKGITSAVIFLDMTSAFYRTLPELVLGSLLNDEGRTVLLGAPSSSMKASEHASRIQAGRPLLTGTPTLPFVRQSAGASPE